MPETYSGDEGADALDAGMSTLDGTEDRRDGWLSINKTRDYIATKTAELKARSLNVWPTNRGGTGSANLYGVTLPTDENGLLVVRPDGALARGSGALAQAYIPSGIPASKITGIPVPDLSSRVAKTGDVMTGNLGMDGGHILVPAAYAATSSYAVAYINGDGRLSKGASSERYKKYISEIDPASLGDIFPTLHRFQMRSGDVGDWKYGYIAERLHEHPEQETCVVYQTTTTHDDETGEWSTVLATDAAGNPVPDSIDFIGLLLAQNAQLHQVIDLLEQRVEALEAR